MMHKLAMGDLCFLNWKQISHSCWSWNSADVIINLKIPQKSFFPKTTVQKEFNDLKLRLQCGHSPTWDVSPLPLGFNPHDAEQASPLEKLKYIFF